MVDRFVMNVIEAIGQVVFIPNGVFPETILPNHQVWVSHGFAKSVGCQPFDLPDFLGEGIVIFWQSDQDVPVVRQDAISQYFERFSLLNSLDCVVKRCGVGVIQEEILAVFCDNR